MKKRIIILITLWLMILSIGCGCSTSSNNQNAELTVELENGSSTDTTEQQISIPTVSHKIDNITFELPDNWVQTSSEESKIVLEYEENKLTIRSETIPAILKIDVGGDSIKSVEDVPIFYRVSEDYLADGFTIIEEKWKSADTLMYYEQRIYPTNPSDEENSRYIVQVIVPINETESVFLATIAGESEEQCLSAIETLISTFEIEQD